MARLAEPDTASTSFFIVTAPATLLDGKYTVFGKVEQGLDVVQAIEAVPVNGETPVTEVTLARRPGRDAGGQSGGSSVGSDEPGGDDQRQADDEGDEHQRQQPRGAGRRAPEFLPDEHAPQRRDQRRALAQSVGDGEAGGAARR